MQFETKEIFCMADIDIATNTRESQVVLDSEHKTIIYINCKI